jgi:hypothetical protein
MDIGFGLIIDCPVSKTNAVSQSANFTLNGDFLKRSASAIGFYEVRECCGNIKKGGVMSSGDKFIELATITIESLVSCISC